MSAFVWLTVLTALRILGRNRLRAGLTMLGIVIGVGAVIAMVSIGEGAKRAVQAQIATMGTNVIIIFPGVTSASGVRGSQGSAVTLTVSDALDLKKRSRCWPIPDGPNAMSCKLSMGTGTGTGRLTASHRVISPFATGRLRVGARSPRRTWIAPPGSRSSAKRSWRICLSQAKSRWGR